MSSPDTKIVGYCRTCGKALDEAGVHTSHGTIFCQEHVPMEIPTSPGAAASSAPPPMDSPYTAPYTAPYSAPQTTGAPWNSGQAPPPVPNADVSPGVAFVLGLIPGVGAIYNGQYAKGLIHVFIIGMMFTILNANRPGPGLEPLLILMLIGFWAYMPFEAFHTSRKRRYGQPVDEFSGLSAGSSSHVRFPALPVLLIAFGVIFLLNNLDILDMDRIVKYWPALMIGLGVYLLWVRMTNAQRSQGGDGQ